MGRIAGIDYGQVRIGLALSDEGKILASPFKVVEGKRSPAKTAQEILKALDERSPIDQIVLGLPLLLNGQDGPMTLEVREVAKHLEALSSLPVILWDERLTSAQVERTLKEANISRKKRTKYVDTMAASTILQSYLDSPRMFP